MHTFTVVFLAALALTTAIQIWLSSRQLRHVAAHRDAVPAAFAATIPLADHTKAADYTRAKLRFSYLELGIGTALLLWWTLGGGLALLDEFWRGLGWSELATGVAYLLSVFLLMALLDTPAGAYRTFVIEARFGFNRTRVGTYLGDMLKGGVLLVLIGAPFAWLLLWLMASMGELWWLYAWLAYMGLSLTTLWAFPTVIAPLFNKFEPLQDQALKARIESLLQRCGFTSRGVYVMDGSRRSSHGNAYFTGMGRNKRIVFFDTLTASLNEEEVEAVLAHELGHFRHHHIRKRLALMTLTTLLGFALLGWLAQQAWFYSALGAGLPSNYMALMLFVLVMPVFSFLLTPLLSAYSRKHEFEADAFAARNSSAQRLIEALVKMYKENAKTLTPDPVYSSFYDSHPPAPIRIAHLASIGG